MVEEGSRLKSPKDSRRLHPHAGLNKGHYSCLTWEKVGEASRQPDKGRVTCSLKEAKGHICAVKDSVGSLWWHPSSWDLVTAQLTVCQGNVTKVWFAQRGNDEYWFVEYIRVKWNCLFVCGWMCVCRVYVMSSSFQAIPYHSHANIRCSLSLFCFLPPSLPPLLSDSFFPLIILAVLFPPSTSPAVLVIYLMPWWVVRWE